MSAIKFPKQNPKLIVLTKQMIRVIKRTLQVHLGSALVVWSGLSRLGKTTTAREMVKKLAHLYDVDDPDAFRCVHYEVGEIAKWGGQEQKRGIRSLYHACVGRLDEGLYRTLPTEDLAKQLVHGLSKKNIKMILIDEAGTLSIDAIRGMVLVRDVAEIEGWTLTLVFIGMDDLPMKMCAVPQIEKRIHEWCFFAEYKVDELFELLTKLDSNFASLNPKNPTDWELVKFVHEKFGGVPGEVVPFLTRLNYRLEQIRESSKNSDAAMSLDMLKAVYLSTQLDKEQAIKSSRSGYDSVPKQDTKNDQKKTKFSGQQNEKSLSYQNK